MPRKHPLVCSALSHVVFGSFHGKGFFISQFNRAVLSRISSTTRFFFFCCWITLFELYRTIKHVWFVFAVFISMLCCTFQCLFPFYLNKKRFLAYWPFIRLPLLLSHQKNVFCLFAANHADVGLFYSKQCYRLLATKLSCFELYLTQHNVFTLLLLSLLLPRTTLFWTWTTLPQAL